MKVELGVKVIPVKAPNSGCGRPMFMLEAKPFAEELPVGISCRFSAAGGSIVAACAACAANFSLLYCLFIRKYSLRSFSLSSAAFFTAICLSLWRCAASFLLTGSLLGIVNDKK
jgi:hypothetical protein